MESVYVMDTSSFIELKNRYPPRVFRSLWCNIEKLCENNRLIAPLEVREEIERGDDDLVKWVKKFKKIFLRPDGRQARKVQEILAQFPFLAHFEKEGPNADPWIIALALSRNKTIQSPLFPRNYIVVTEELRAKPNKIPFVCEHYGIECINLLELFRRENWQF